MAREDQRFKDLTKLLYYVLGRRPDEWGLIPDEEGWISLKDLFRASSWEKRSISKGDLQELVMKGARIELEENRIRAKEILFQKEPCTEGQLPRLLYTFIRARAHEEVFREGIPQGPRMLPVYKTRQDAEEAGRKRTKDPLVLELDARALWKKGIRFYLLGELLLVERVPADAILGPRPETNEERPKRQRRAVRPEGEATPGSFALRPMPQPGKPLQKGRKPKGWKEAARKTRKDH